MKITLEFTTSQNLAYIELYDDKREMSINYDDDIANFLGLKIEVYKERFRKIYDDRFIVGLNKDEDLYLSVELFKTISKEEIIDKFKEEFCEELTLAVM